LQRWTKHSLSEPATDRSVLSMEERLTLAFLSVSQVLIDCRERATLGRRYLSILTNLNHLLIHIGGQDCARDDR
jgi:hypothetical protein